MEQSVIKELLKSEQTVFSFNELLLKFKIDVKLLKRQLNYYVKRGDLYHIRRGLYAKDNNYDRLELATKILTPSYISFETVLRSAGIIFQYYNSVFIASYQSREIVCDKQTYIFRTIKSTILTNAQGIDIRGTYSIATPERAFLDTLYHTKGYHFDNLKPLNWETIYALLPIYGDIKSLKKRVDAYHQTFKEEKEHAR